MLSALHNNLAPIASNYLFLIQYMIHKEGCICSWGGGGGGEVALMITNITTKDNEGTKVQNHLHLCHVQSHCTRILCIIIHSKN